MSSILTVVTPAAPPRRLVQLSVMQAETGSTASNLDRWIQEATGLIESECDRVFQIETIAETHRGPLYQAVLTRTPIVEIISVVEGGVTRDVGDYEFDKVSGMIRRKSVGLTSGFIGDGTERNLRFDDLARFGGCRYVETVVTYRGGYADDAIPYDLQRACMEMVKQSSSAASRDPMLRSVDVPGVISRTYWVGSTGANGSSLPQVANEVIDRYRVMRFG